LQEKIRLAAFDWLSKQIRIHGDEVLPRELLAQGFEFEGQRIPLLGPQGIFKPRLLELPLSITTVPNGPYSDEPDKDGNWIYKYRGTDLNHRDNTGLREAMKRQVPLIYFIGMRPGRYLATFPVFIVADYPGELAFKVMADDKSMLKGEPHEIGEPDEGRRRYVTVGVRVRLHQRGFRERVLHAYQEQCACCRLRHLELLDAAHIVGDVDPDGEPLVNNGISLCKLHHAAFDSNILGIRPDYVIEINKEVLEEEDGPMLRHGLQGLHQTQLTLPRSKNLYPDQRRLEARYSEFRSN
jgi:putative restriction endonuclease